MPNNLFHRRAAASIDGSADGAEDPREGASSLMAITLSTELGSQSQSHSFLSSSFTAWSADGVKWAGKFDSSNNIAASYGRTPISGRKSPPRCPISPFSFPLSTAAAERESTARYASMQMSDPAQLQKPDSNGNNGLEEAITRRETGPHSI